MNARKLYYWHHKLMFLKAWYFLLPALVFALLAVNGLRGNYAKMVELREAVYVADQQNGDVEGALTQLRSHVYGHMNTNLTSGQNPIKPPIQLKARYDRLMVAEQERIKQATAAVNAQAEQVCAARFPNEGLNAPRITCIQEYVDANDATKSRNVPDQLYKFDFVSPKWSPDQAGISIVLSFLFGLLFVARVILEYTMRRRLN